MGYLRRWDYERLIQEANLLQLISSNQMLRTDSEDEAIEEVQGYLRQKYDVAKEFLETYIWDPLVSYKGNNLVELNYSDFNNATAYAVNSLFIFTDGYAYLVTTLTAAGQTPVTNPAKFTKLGAKYALYYVTLPKEEFDYTKYYKKGDQVFWKNKTYTAQIDTPALSHEVALQYGKVTNVPQRNVFPDDSIAGVQYWGTGTSYSVTAGVVPTDTTKWTAGDNRSKVIVQKTIDICLYHIHSRIAPRNIPQLRIDRYNAACKYLEQIAEGIISADIPLLQPKTDGMIRYGSDVRRQNDY